MNNIPVKTYCDDGNYYTIKEYIDKCLEEKGIKNNTSDSEINKTLKDIYDLHETYCTLYNYGKKEVATIEVKRDLKLLYERVEARFKEEGSEDE
jgi:hypothetical protein